MTLSKQQEAAQKKVGNRQWFSIPANMSVKDVEGVPRNDDGSYSIKAKPENVEKMVEQLISRTRKELLDEIEAGLPKEKEYPMLGASSFADSVTEQKNGGFNDYRAEVLSLLKTLREGISSNDSAK